MYGDPVLVAPSAARTASGSTASIELIGGGETIGVLLDVSAVSGTSPNLVVSLEWSNDGTNWAVPETADAFTALTTAVKRVKTFERKALFHRVVWTITGTTPSFTFQVWEYTLT